MKDMIENLEEAGEIVKARYEYDGYTIECTDTSVKVIIDGEENTPMPLGVVSILPRIQLKLGEDIRKFQEYMLNLNSNYMIIGNKQSRRIETWDFVRLEDELIPKEKSICSIITINNNIVSITYNQSLLDDREFREAEKLSLLQQIRFKSNNDMASVLLAIRTLTHETVKNLLLLEDDNGRLEIRHKTKNVKFVFTFTGTKGYTLSSIGLNSVR